jgi:hypothetical protein
MKSFLPAVMILGLLSSDAAARQWNSRAGGYKVEAEFVEVKDGKVLLRLADGSQVSVLLEKLSEADVEYVNDVLKAAQAGTAGKAAAPATAAKPSDSVAPGAASTTKPADATAPAAGKPATPLDKETEDVLADLNSGTESLVKQRLKLLTTAAPAKPNREVAKVLEALLLNSTGISQRPDIAKALINWSTEESIPVLNRSIQAENSPFVAPALIEAVMKYKPDSAIEPIARHLPNALTRKAASQALKSYGPIAEEAVAAHLTSGDIWTRQEACEILKIIGTRKSIPALEQVARERDVFVSGAAKVTLKVIRQNPNRTAPKTSKAASGGDPAKKGAGKEDVGVAP